MELCDMLWLCPLCLCSVLLLPFPGKCPCAFHPIPLKIIFPNMAQLLSSLHKKQEPVVLFHDHMNDAYATGWTQAVGNTPELLPR